MNQLVLTTNNFPAVTKPETVSKLLSRLMIWAPQFSWREQWIGTKTLKSNRRGETGLQVVLENECQKVAHEQIESKNK